ncbi:MAG: hypothetical protein QHC90_02615 [Shinella sp.]|nr:hypothetical protein [Shinella sp.]
MAAIWPGSAEKVGSGTFPHADPINKFDFRINKPMKQVQSRSRSP